MAAEKVTFTLPEELVRRLAKIPAGMKSKLVKEAVERELERQSAVAKLKKLRGKPFGMFHGASDWKRIR